MAILRPPLDADLTGACDASSGQVGGRDALQQVGAAPAHGTSLRHVQFAVKDDVDVPVRAA